MEIWSVFLFDEAVAIGASACGKDTDFFHISAPATIPATRMNVAVQLMIVKRWLLKNDENLDILICGVIAHHGMVKLLACLMGSIAMTN